MKIERVTDICGELFLKQYVERNEPVIVCDGTENWPARKRWTPEYLCHEVGDIEVQVYDDLFGLQDIVPLRVYIGRSFGRTAEQIGGEYVRAFSKLKDIDFYWADEIFRRLQSDWAMPYFLPEGGYAVPVGPVRAESSYFPYRGLFVSCAGCRTRLHRDPWTTSAILCQVQGRKHITMYAPSEAPKLLNGTEFVDIDLPEHLRSPDSRHAVKSHDDILEPGEILFIPSGWLHHVVTLSDSISLTWNFVHGSGLERLLDYLATHPNDPELEVLQFFLGQANPLPIDPRNLSECLRALNRAGMQEG